MDMVEPKNGTSALSIEQNIFVFGGNNEKDGFLNNIDNYLINYDKWDHINLKLKHKIQDLQTYQLNDYRVLIIGGIQE